MQTQLFLILWQLHLTLRDLQEMIPWWDLTILNKVNTTSGCNFWERRPPQLSRLSSGTALVKFPALWPNIIWFTMSSRRISRLLIITWKPRSSWLGQLLQSATYIFVLPRWKCNNVWWTPIWKIPYSLSTPFLSTWPLKWIHGSSAWDLSSQAKNR